MCFGPEQQQNWSVFDKNADLLCRRWWIWSRNPSMIPLPVFVNLFYELILKFKWCSNSLQPQTHVFWAKAATQLVGFPKNVDLLCRRWWIWRDINLWFPSQSSWTLFYEIILKFKWCSTSLQPYTHVFWAKSATQLVGFWQKYGFALQKMVNLELKSIYDSPPPSLRELFYELILKFKWCSTSLQPCTHVFWAKEATQLLNFALK